MNRKSTIIFLFLLAAFTDAIAQSCPANIDFESGLGSWIFYRGSVAAGPVYSFTATPPVAGLHTLTSGSGTDAYGGFPVVAPGGGMHSLKIGHDSANSSAEKASYFIHVPTTGTFTMDYMYAVVFGNDISHPASQQARFIITANDSVTGLAVTCDSIEYVSSGTDPGFLAVSGSTSQSYRPWTTGHLKFAGFAGHTIRLDIIAAGSSTGTYWCYGYFDMSCNLYQDTTYPCGAGTFTLAASDGYSAYHWDDSATFTTSYGSSQTVVVTSPTSATTYAVILTPYFGYGCTDTFYTHVVSGSPAPISGPSSLCTDSSITLTDATTGGIWTSSNSLIASIGSSTGIVSGSAAGTDTITYATGTCTTRKVITVNATCALGVVHANQEMGIILFPNPNSGEFTISMSSACNEPVVVTLTNLLGITTGQWTIETNKPIHLGKELPQGVYVLIAVSQHGYFSGKLTIAR